MGTYGYGLKNTPNIVRIAKAALGHNLPLTLSTVTTSSVDRIAEITGGKSWFQLYHPAEEKVNAIRLGVDVLIVSNLRGRQPDTGQSKIVPMIHLVKKYKDQIIIMVDSGLRGGPDIARAMASGAEFTFMGVLLCRVMEHLGKKAVIILFP